MFTVLNILCHVENLHMATMTGLSEALIGGGEVPTCLAGAGNFYHFCVL